MAHCRSHKSFGSTPTESLVSYLFLNGVIGLYRTDTKVELHGGECLLFWSIFILLRLFPKVVLPFITTISILKKRVKKWGAYANVLLTGEGIRVAARSPTTRSKDWKIA